MKKDYRFTKDYFNDFGDLVQSLHYPLGSAIVIRNLEHTLINVIHPHRYIEFWLESKIHQYARIIDEACQDTLRTNLSSRIFDSINRPNLQPLVSIMHLVQTALLDPNFEKTTSDVPVVTQQDIQWAPHEASKQQVKRTQALTFKSLVDAARTHYPTRVEAADIDRWARSSFEEWDWNMELVVKPEPDEDEDKGSLLAKLIKARRSSRSSQK